MIILINKVISVKEAADMVKEGMTIMVGGFLANGTPERIIDALVEKNVKNLTLICNDTGSVSYTHLDVYKRQGYIYAWDMIL